MIDCFHPWLRLSRELDLMSGARFLQDVGDRFLKDER